MEEEIAKHILLFEKRMFGLTIDDVRKLAFDVAEKHGLSHQFNKEEKKAAKKWYYNFMARNPQLSLRQPQKTSIQRVRGFAEERVKKL
jgi:hypothetical protein